MPTRLPEVRSEYNIIYDKISSLSNPDVAFTVSIPVLVEKEVSVTSDEQGQNENEDKQSEGKVESSDC